ncbi:MAG: peptide deformylase [Clostridiales bacterium]|nr:peptide deformylase [Clostridiales bacterium]
MALRTIRVEGDPILRKECRPVKEMNERTHILINDMFDTMYEADGVGLAGPQVGILKRLCVIDCGDDPLVLINPEIVSVEGEQIGQEGCLSVPGKYGIVKRPAKVTVRALNEDMEEYEVTGEGLLARALCHEIGHLDGQMYVDLVIGELHSYDEEMESEEIEEMSE